MTSPFPQITSPPQAQAEVIVNEAFETLAASAVYGKNHALTSGLTWGYYGGRWAALGIAAGSVTLAASATNYVVVAVATGAVSVSAATTNWNDAVAYRRAFKIVTGASSVTSFEDHRFAAGGALTATAGSSGGGGGASGLSFTANTTTTDADPGTGTLRWNNATQANATQLFIDNADADSTSLATLWASLTSGAFLKIADAANVDLWQLWKVTAAPVSGTGYYKFTVALQAQEGGNIANAAAILLDVDAAGGGAGLPVGGTTGQALVKLSGADGDAGWRTPSGGGGGTGGVPTASYKGLVAGNFTNASAAAFVPLGAYAASIAASVGDILEIELSGLPSGSPMRFSATINGAALTEQFYIAPPSGAFEYQTFRFRHSVVSGDLASGVVPVVATWKLDGSGTATWNDSSSGQVGLLTVKNYGDGSGIRPSNAGAVFSAYATGATPLAAGVDKKVALAGEEFDSASAFDAVTNSRFQPAIAGYYQLAASVTFHATSTIAQCVAIIYKNGTAYKSGSYHPGYFGGGNSYAISHVSTLVYLNGATDYVELIGNMNVAGEALASAGETFLNGFLARLA